MLWSGLTAAGLLVFVVECVDKSIDVVIARVVFVFVRLRVLAVGFEVTKAFGVGSGENRTGKDFGGHGGDLDAGVE